ncbi:MAG: hypothetical protein GBAus27B_000111 [Mycoplasmataceae bacterium]|nr:MAG: hypothetical protein GBAus27B_000111 [Mycoplasmataceae bacterium]
MVNIENELSKKIENTLKKDEKEVNIIELIDVADKLIFFETQGLSSIDMKTINEFFNLFGQKLEDHFDWLLANRSKLGEKHFSLQISKLSRFRKFLSKENQKIINQISPESNEKENQSFFSHPPTNYKFWLIMWTGTVIFLSFISFCIINLVINRIKNKKNSKKQ